MTSPISILLFTFILLAAQANLAGSRLTPVLKTSEKSQCTRFYFGDTVVLRNDVDLIRGVERPHMNRLVDHRKAFYHYEAHSSSLSAQAKAAIANYKGTGYAEINKYLRTGKSKLTDAPLAEMLQVIEDIDQSIDSGPSVPQFIVVFRGMSLSKNHMIPTEPGSVVTAKGFVSTSLSARTSMNFARPYSGNEEQPVLQVIHVRKKKIRGLYIDNEANFYESEILLDRESSFRVLQSQWVLVDSAYEGLNGFGIGLLPPTPPIVPPVNGEKQFVQLELFPELPGGTITPGIPNLPGFPGFPSVPGDLPTFPIGPTIVGGGGGILPIGGPINSPPPGNVGPYRLLIQHVEVFQE